MTVVALMSVKGSPGVTTAASALAVAAVAAGNEALLAELDPSGGDVRLLAAVPAPHPNLVHAAGELRHAPGAAGTLAGQAVEVLPGLPGLVAPAGSDAAAAAVASLGDAWVTAFRSYPGRVLVDLGRWDQGQHSAGRLQGYDAVGLVVRATAGSVEHARHMVASVRREARCPVAAVVVGHRPYPAEAVADALDLPLAGCIPWDPRGAAAMWVHGCGSGGVRTRLVRSAARTLAGLEAQVPARHAARSEATGAPAAVGGGERG